MKTNLALVLLLAAVSLNHAADPSAPSAVAIESKPSEALSKDELAGFRSRLLATTTKHLDLLLKPDGKVANLKGKSADGMTALAFQLVYEMTGNQKYRAAAMELADRIVTAMKATKHGVLFIKEKDKGSGEPIAGGGPPAFGWYASAAAYVLHKEGGREDDLRYIAAVADNFPWNESGWWANTVDINTGQPKEPLTKAGAINKNAGMALAAGMLSACVQEIDPALSARLKAKADKCVYSQIIPAQEPDGFWHYGLKGNDSNGLRAEPDRADDRPEPRPRFHPQHALHAGALRALERSETGLHARVHPDRRRQLSRRHEDHRPLDEKLPAGRHRPGWREGRGLLRAHAVAAPAGTGEAVTHSLVCR